MVRRTTRGETFSPPTKRDSAAAPPEILRKLENSSAPNSTANIIAAVLAVSTRTRANPTSVSPPCKSAISKAPVAPMPAASFGVKIPR